MVPVKGSLKKGIPKVYALSGGDANWMKGRILVKNPDEADIIVFPGGADINPALYGQRPHQRTSYSNYSDSQQIDIYERYAGKKAFFGICRGLQLLSVMSGAILVQDISHPGSHKIYTYDGKELRTNSLHHQQVCVSYMKEGDYKLLAWAQGESNKFRGEGDFDYMFNKNYKEPEVVFFPHTNVLGIQGHPEMSSMPQATTDWLVDQVQTYLEW